MSSHYMCYKCLFKTSKRYNIIKHFNRKRKCVRNTSCSYSDDEIKLLNEKQLEEKFKHKINNDEMDELLQKIHLNNEEKEIPEKQNNIFNQTTNNTMNNNTMNITNNIMNININISNNLIPFNEDWDLSSISEKDKIYLIFSKVMYTKLLELILKNDINSNVIIDNDAEQGLVFYKYNEENKYEHIKLDQLVNDSVYKLHKQLIEIYKSIMDDLSDDIKSNIIKPTFLNEFLKAVEEKYDNFKNKSNIKKNVKEMIVEIYKNNQDKALMIMKEKGEKKHLIDF